MNNSGLISRSPFWWGDSTTDILAGIRADCRTILVQTGFAAKNGKAVAEPDVMTADISEAVDLVLSRWPA